MKKILLIMTILVATFMMFACGTNVAKTEEGTQANAENTVAAETPKKKIVCTMFPVYDWVNQVIGDKASEFEVSYLLDSGVDLHNFQPSAADIVKIKDCDMFIYVGGESDAWVDDVFNNVVDKDIIKINLLEVLGDKVKVEETKEGMQHEHEHEHEHIETKEIEERDLSKFNGEFKSLYPLGIEGSLDEYIEHHAKEHGEPVEEVKEEVLTNWLSDIVEVKIEGDVVTLTYQDGKVSTGKYINDGYQLIKNDEGEITSVRYQYVNADGNIPKYILLNDHNYKKDSIPEHFHLYVAENNVEEVGTSNPFYVPKTSSINEILEMLEHHGHEEELDEHVWLSLKNAKYLCGIIKDNIVKLDSNNKATYEANLNNYNSLLDALDKKYEEVAKNASTKVLLFGDRFPFRYLVDDYGIDYYAAFSGCSAETEASFETIAFLTNKVDELGLKHVLKIEGPNDKIAKTIISNSKSKDQDVIEMDSMQSTSKGDVNKGATYLGVMENNLLSFEKALN